MSEQQFPHTFRPLQVGMLTLPHRIFVTAHNVGTADANDLPDERSVQYYLARARGGAAILFSGGSPVHRNSYSTSGKCWALWDSRFPAALRKVTDSLGELGVPFVVQLHNHGAYGTSRRHELPLWSVSDSRVLKSRREPPHVMTIAELREVIESYGSAAARAREGGASGVEIVCGANGLISEFNSPLLNRRTDEYGGSEENRMRFCYEVVETVRRAVGDDFSIGIKVTGDDREPGSLTLEDHLRIVPQIVARGKIDWVTTFMGFAPSFTSGPMNVPPHFVPQGYQKYVATGLKSVLNIPLMFSGRVVSPFVAEQLLADGLADMVGMTRAHISDPEIVRKMREGRTDEIRVCVGSNNCVGRRERGTFVSCVQNPDTGREGIEWVPLEQTATTNPRRVLVIGGGVAGMEVARVAATRGHQVSLYERSGELGGQVNIARRAPRRGELGLLVTNKRKEMARAGVAVHLGVEVTPELVASESPDVVVLATGARVYRPHDLPGSDRAHVVTAWDVLLGRATAGQKVLIVDGDREEEGLNVAELLSGQGKQVELITKSYYAGVNVVDHNTVPLLYQKILGNGVKLTYNTWVARIEERDVVLYDVYTRQERTIQDVDTVVLALGGIANDGLAERLRAAGQEVHLIGDCVAPRDLEYAVLDGHKLGRAL